MIGFLLLLTGFIFINLGLISIGVVFGFLFHWIFPSIDLGMSMLIAVISTGFSIHYFLRFLWYSELLPLPKVEETEDLPSLWYYPKNTRLTPKRKRKS